MVCYHLSWYCIQHIKYGFLIITFVQAESHLIFEDLTETYEINKYLFFVAETKDNIINDSETASENFIISD